MSEAHSTAATEYPNGGRVDRYGFHGSGGMFAAGSCDLSGAASAGDDDGGNAVGRNGGAKEEV